MKYFYAHIKSASGATGLQITRADKENDLRKLIEDKKKTGHILKVLRTGHLDKLFIESVDLTRYWRVRNEAGATKKSGYSNKAFAVGSRKQNGH